MKPAKNKFVRIFSALLFVISFIGMQYKFNLNSMKIALLHSDFSEWLLFIIGAILGLLPFVFSKKTTTPSEVWLLQF